MKKILNTFVLVSFFVILMCSISVNAAEHKCSFENIPGTLIVKGEIAVSEQEYPNAITVKVLDEEGELNYYDIIYTDDLGKAEFSYKNMKSGGNYTCYFNINSTNETIKAELKDFKDKNFQNDFVSQVMEAIAKKDIEKIDSLITENDYWLHTDRSVYDTLKNKDKVYNIMIDENENYNQAIDIIKAFERSAYLQAANEKGASGIKSLYIADKDNKLFDFDSVMPEYQDKNVFEALSDKTKDYIFTSCVKTYAKCSDLKSEILLKALTTGINKAANYNEVQMLLNAYKNAGLISYTKNLSVSDYKALIGKSFSTYSDVTKAIASLNSESQTTFGGGGGGGSSGGKAPISIEVMNGGNNNQPIENNTEIIDNDTIQNTNLNKYFDDIEDSKWAMDAINYLYEMGIINGTGDRTFEPNRNVTRAEMAKMIALLSKSEMNGNTASFGDVDNNAWYAPYVFAVVNNGYFKGYENGMFGVVNPITREQASAVVYRYLLNERQKFTITEYRFDDDDIIADWAKSAVYSLYSGNIITGRSNTTFSPLENITRAECAVLMYRAAKSLE